MLGLGHGSRRPVIQQKELFPPQKCNIYGSTRASPGGEIEHNHLCTLYHARYDARPLGRGSEPPIISKPTRGPRHDFFYGFGKWTSLRFFLGRVAIIPGRRFLPPPLWSRGSVFLSLSEGDALSYVLFGSFFREVLALKSVVGRPYADRQHQIAIRCFDA